MSVVKSVRLDENADYNLKICCERLGLPVSGVITKALESYVTKVLENENDVVRVDFHNCVDGVNSNIVDCFIQEINEFTNFETFMYLDYDEVAFKLKEN